MQENSAPARQSHDFLATQVDKGLLIDKGKNGYALKRIQISLRFEFVRLWTQHCIRRALRCAT